jgi:hypothetical protein
MSKWRVYLTHSAAHEMGRRQIKAENRSLSAAMQEAMFLYGGAKDTTELEVQGMRALLAAAAVMISGNTKLPGVKLTSQDNRHAVEIYRSLLPRMAGLPPD